MGTAHSLLYSTNCDSFGKFKCEENKKKKALEKLLTQAQVQTIKTAKQLDDAQIVYLLYGLVDGLSLTYSNLKCAFDLLFSHSGRSTSDLLHEWLSTPEGAAIAAAEAVTIIGFSMLANVFSSRDKNALKRYTAIVWTYCRNSMKAMKNAYKGVRSSLQIASTLAGQNWNVMAVPLGLVLGGVSVLNRLWYQHMIFKRKSMMSVNEKLLKAIKKMPCKERKKDGSYEDHSKQQRITIGNKRYVIDKQTLTVCEETIGEWLDVSQLHTLTDTKRYTSLFQVFANQAAFQKNTRRNALLSQMYSGFVDGLYLYMGVMGLSVLNPPAFAALSLVCVLLTAACMATRMYEEHDYQKKLFKSQDQVRLLLCGKELESLFKAVCELTQQDDLADPAHLSSLILALNHKINSYNMQLHTLNNTYRLSYKSAALTGMRHGLAAYSAIACVLFSAAIVCTLCSAPVPPALVVAAVLLGFACLLGFTTFALYRNSQQIQKRDMHIKQLTGALNKNGSKMRESLHSGLDTLHHTLNDLKPLIENHIFDKLLLDPSPQFLFQELFEVVRSWVSGITKGIKAIEFSLNPLQEMDAHGHYQDTPIMLWLAIGVCALHSMVLGLRALAKQFAKFDLDEPVKKEPHGKQPQVPHQSVVQLQSNNDAPEDGAHPLRTRKRSFSYRAPSNMTLFQSSPLLRRANSESQINHPTPGCGF